MIKHNWYGEFLEQENYVQQEAGAKENILIALLSLSIVGLDAQIFNLVSQRRNLSKKDLKEQIVQNGPEFQKAKEIILNKDKDKFYAQLYEKAKKEGEEMKQMVTNQTSKQVVSPQDSNKAPAQSIKNKVEQKKDKSKKKSVKGIDLSASDQVISTIKALEGSNSTDISYAGAVGTMQIMPNTWKYVNEKYFNNQYPFEKYKFDEKINKKIGVQYINELVGWLKKHQGEWKADPHFLLFVAYNAGPGNVHKCKFDKATIKKSLPSAFDYGMRGTNIMFGAQEI